MIDSPLGYGGVSVFLVTIISVIFFFRLDVKFWLVACAVPLSFIPGVVLYLFEEKLQEFQRRIEMSANRLQAGFLILFAFLVGYIVVFSLLFIYPMGLVGSLFSDQQTVDHYGHWMVNLAIIASLAGWLRCQLSQNKK